MTFTPTDAEQKCADALQEKFPASCVSPDDKHFLLPNVYLRYAREHDGNVEKATAAFQATLDWRAESRPWEIEPSRDTPAALSAVFLSLAGDDKQGRAVMTVTLARENAADSDERVKLFLYCLEALAANGKEFFILINDFTTVGKHKDPAGTETRDKLARMLDQHYPERCQLIYMYNTPWFISVGAPLQRAFLSRKMKKRLRDGCGTKDLLKDIDSAQLPVPCGGKYELTENVVLDFAKRFSSE